MISEALNADRPDAVTFTYDRSEMTNIVSAVTISCIGVAGPVTRAVPKAVERDGEAKLVAIRETCASTR
jgi:hypothetical protein